MNEQKTISCVRATCAPFTCRRERQLRGKQRLIEESLFPGYLFIRMPALVGTLRSTRRGVSEVVAFGGRPLAVSHALITHLQLRAQTHVIPAIGPGDEVTILDEGFEGVESIFVAMDGNERVVLLIHLMNQQQQITLPITRIAGR